MILTLLLTLLIGGGVKMGKKQKQNKTARKAQEETKTGFGNKKTEGPDRPST